MPEGMDLGQRKEQFSIAYVRAIASAAGFSTAQPEVDNDSIDLKIQTRLPGSPELNMQLKCTSSPNWREDTLRFRLKAKNYDDLSRAVMVPRILVVVVVPDDVDTWLEQTPDHLILRRCGYWKSLFGQPPRDSLGSPDSVTVKIPSKQTLTVRSLTELLEKVGRRETL